MSAFKRLTTYEPDDNSTDINLRRLLEQHRTYLDKHPKTRNVPVDAGLAVKFKYNLTGYLSTSKVPVRIHWITMILTGLSSEADFDTNVKMLRIPDIQEVDKIITTSGF